MTVAVHLGRVYVIAGRGEMLAHAFTRNPNCTEFLAHGNIRYWASHDQVHREAKASDLDARHEQAKPRGVHCRDANCWCWKVAGRKVAPPAPRGTIKAFREHLNAKYAGDRKHRERRFEQKTRAYGDYLYAQDREKFDVELDEALRGEGPNADFKAVVDALRAKTSDVGPVLIMTAAEVKDA